jgi:membrane protease YdiL (CAAX protease family)
VELELWQFINALILVLLSFGVALWYGFYTLPKGPAIFRSPPSFIHVLMVFVVFLALQIVIIPSITYLGMSVFSGQGLNPKLQMTENQQSWIYIASIYLTAPAIWWFADSFNPVFIRSLVGNNRSGNKLEQNVHDLSMGAITWFLAFPIVLVFGSIMQEIVERAFHPPEVDQLAVQLFKNSFQNPWQVVLTFIGLVIPVPLTEELLFRGYFQQWLKSKVSLPSAIMGTSLLFATVHLSTTHGWHNLELFPTLFLLSCFLGFLVERQQSLWASIGLHAAFNFVSVSLITFQIESVSV